MKPTKKVELDRSLKSQEIDLVNRPPHYQKLSIQPILAIESWKLCFNLGQVVKYVARAGGKNQYLTDLRKARYYLSWEIELGSAALESRAPKSPEEMGA